MTRCLLAALGIGLVSSAHYKDWQPGSCDLSGAEEWLEHFGIGPGLPKLEVRYGHFATREYAVHGSDTNFAKGKEELKSPPQITWAQTGKYTESKYMVLLVAPDEQLCNSDGSGCAVTWRPRLLWMTLNCQKTASSGHAIFPYEPPSPRLGQQRYIAILFQQVKPGDLGRFMQSRVGWDFEGFMQANRESLRAVSYNFFYVDADLDPNDELAALGFGEDEDDYPTS